MQPSGPEGFPAENAVFPVGVSSWSPAHCHLGSLANLPGPRFPHLTRGHGSNHGGLLSSGKLTFLARFPIQLTFLHVLDLMGRANRVGRPLAAALRHAKLSQNSDFSPPKGLAVFSQLLNFEVRKLAPGDK